MAFSGFIQRNAIKKRERRRKHKATRSTGHTEQKTEKRKTQIERADKKKNKGTNERIKTKQKHRRRIEKHRRKKKRRKIQRGNICTEDE